MAFGEPKLETGDSGSLQHPREEGDLEKKEKETAVILDFQRKGDENIGEGKEQGYEEYKTLGGVLSQEQYLDVLRHAAGEEGGPSAALSSSANFMAEVAGIALSPETVTIYGILRHEKPGQASESYHGMSDQKLLAEALRITGDTHSLPAFIEKHPHIFN